MKTLPNRLRIEVTERNIKRGHREEMDSCPIAMAVRRETRARDVSVASEIRVTLRNGERGTYALTQRADNFIETFDAEGRKAVKPMVMVFRRIQ